MENEEERESVHPIICFDYKNINLGKEMFNGGGVPFEHAQKTHIKTLIITNYLVTLTVTRNNGRESSFLI